MLHINLRGTINRTRSAQKKGLQAMRETHNPLFLFGGAGGIRNHDLLTASESQEKA